MYITLNAVGAAVSAALIFVVGCVTGAIVMSTPDEDVEEEE